MSTLIKKIHQDAVIPKYETEGSVGFDLTVIDEYIIPPGTYTYLRTGLVIKPPLGYSINIYPRSSTFKKYKVIMPNSVGIVDTDYCGDRDEIMIPVYNINNFYAKIPKGSRVAQAVLVPVCKFDIKETEEQLALFNRDGFGSTGE